MNTVRIGNDENVYYNPNTTKVELSTASLKSIATNRNQNQQHPQLQQSILKESRAPLASIPLLRPAKPQTTVIQQIPEQKQQEHQQDQLASSFMNITAETLEDDDLSIIEDEQTVDFVYIRPGDFVMNNPQFVTEYELDIYEVLKNSETKYMVPHDYIDKQTDLNGVMRAILVDWLAEVTVAFELSTETFFLSVNLVDRFLNERRVTRAKLQLVGMAAILIASKYEEVSIPEVDDFIEVGACAYQRSDLILMETQILSTVDFCVTVTSPLPFVRRYLEKCNCSTRVKHLSHLLLEMSIVDTTSLQFKPSLLASSAIYLANHILSEPAPWSLIFLNQTGYTESELRVCTSSLLKTAQYQASEYKKPAERRKIHAIMTKYHHKRYLRIASILCNGL
jgi:hypothetical protein